MEEKMSRLMKDAVRAEGREYPCDEVEVHGGEHDDGYLVAPA